jgi:acyl-coenzyme A synthetase/AMP-(fatty) acid ligase
VAVYACLAARRLAVMLDAEHPSERNAAMIGATDVKLLLTSGPGMASVAEVSALALEPLDNVGPLPVAGLDSARELLDVDAPAFILCTSGSTGAPKAIVHSQRNLLHMARTGHDGFHFGEDDRLLALSSPAALGGLAPLLHVPLTGATLQLLNLKARGISGLFSDLQRYPISILGAAPSLLRGLSRLPAAGAAFASTRIEQTYGEPLTRDDVRLLRTVLPANCDIRNGYGATEAGGMSWFAQVDDEHDPIRIAAGAPMPDTEAALIDADGAPCAAGRSASWCFAAAMQRWTNMSAVSRCPARSNATRTMPRAASIAPGIWRAMTATACSWYSGERTE